MLLLFWLLPLEIKQSTTTAVPLRSCCCYYCCPCLSIITTGSSTIFCSEDVRAISRGGKHEYVQTDRQTDRQTAGGARCEQYTRSIGTTNATPTASRRQCSEYSSFMDAQSMVLLFFFFLLRLVVVFVDIDRGLNKRRSGWGLSVYVLMS